MNLPGLDLPALELYLGATVTDLAGPLTATLITGGKSNLTYALSDGEHRWVLRRPPLGPLTPSAHDMAREYRVLDALQSTAVPVARTVALCEDTDVIGVPFGVVSFVQGRTLQDGADAETLTTAQAAACADALIDTLVSLHSVAHEEVGLGDFGRSEGFLARQVKRWRGQWDRVATRELEDLQQLHALLAESVPVHSGTGIVHGDYRLDNTILDSADPGRVRAVVDWEMATIGDPLADLGLLMVYWDPVTEPVLGVRHAPTANIGFPSADALAQRYAGATGADLEALAFYRALGFFKIAVIAEGIHQRYLAGKTVGPGFDKVGTAVPELLAAGLSMIGAVR
ncbi:phosphotransferase family protein [Nocardia sp. NPDC004860]|uniref:phosphotransferase family protein n=1 Tax=Nocardia sp. NPDC004860 TaxID=3154557 RepID=UPI0033B76893